MKKVKLLSIDAEFTAWDMIGGDMIEFSATEVLEDLTIGRSIAINLRPRGEKYFTEGARNIHGVSYFKAMTFTDRSTAINQFLNWLTPIAIDGQLPLRTAYYGSWNFDLGWLEQTMRDEGYYSQFTKIFSQRKEDHENVYKMAKDKLKHITPHPDRGKEGDYKLDNVARFYNLDHDHHKAESDAYVTAQIYINLLQEKDTWSGRLL